MSKIEEMIIEFIKKYFGIVILLLGAIAGYVVRKQGMYFISADYTTYLQPWAETLNQNCGFKGLAMDFYTYYIPYMCVLAIPYYFEQLDLLTFIKVVSIVSEYACALAGMILCIKLTAKEERKQSWGSVLFLILILSPMMLLNGAYWGQCDYIYIAFGLFSIWMLYSEKYDLSLILFGLGICFKLQMIFLLPAYLLFYLCNKKFSILKFIYIPVCYLIGGLPAVIAGRPAKDVYKIYLQQTDLFGQLSMNTPNIWRFFPNMEYQDFEKWGIALTMAIFCILGFYVFKKNCKLSQQSFLYICVCSAGICVMFLPGMHERYTALYCILAYIYYATYNRKKLFIAAGIDLLSCITYFQYLYNIDTLSLYPLFAVFNLSILLYIIYDTICVLKATDKSHC